MSNPLNIPPPPLPQQQPYIQQFPYNYYQLYPFNGYTYQSTQQSSHHYHLPHLTTPDKYTTPNTNTYHQTVHNKTVPINTSPSEQHNIKLQSNSIIVNHNSTQNNTFSPSIQQPNVSPNHSLKNEQNGITNDQKTIVTGHKQHKHYNYKHSNSETIAIDTDPITYLDTHDIIQNSFMKQLIKRSAGRLSKLNLKIYGLCEIGNYLWLKVTKKKRGPVEFNKIKALKFQEFIQWIKLQTTHTTGHWKEQICNQPSAEKVLENIVKKCKNIKKRQQLEKCVHKYRNRLMNFIHAVRRLYGIKHKKTSKVKHKYKKSDGCWRCGRTNHKCYECRARFDVDGNSLTEQNESHTEMEQYNEQTLISNGCWRCGRSDHKFWRDCREILDIYGNKLTEESDTLRFKHNDETLQSCIKCVVNRTVYDDNNLIIHKRKLTDCVHATIECEPVFKKRKIDNDNGEIKIKIEISDDNSIDTSTDGINNYCWNCDKDLEGEDMWRCSRCKVSLYCDRQCQLDHWKIHKLKCEVAVDTGMQIKLEKIGVNEWNHYAIIYWLNRVNDNMFNNINYKYLRKHIVMGKIKGCDLLLINKVTLRMMGIENVNEQDALLNAISNIVMNDDFDNVLANRMKINDIPIKYVDPILYEIMDEPVEVMQSRFIYDRKFIEEYIKENKSDPMTQRYTDLSDIVTCEQLSIEIEKWKQQYLISLT